MTSLLATLWQDRRGQDFTEYALMAGLLTTVAVAIVPDMFSIVQHVGAVLLSVTQSAAEVATLK
jgi:Flp pilus assembly pilin Flp